jgi:putative FmdB family regulatory protein
VKAVMGAPPIIEGFALSLNTLVMPIYAYKCGSCGHAKDVLQKISDPLLTVCPACGAEAFSKQITAAGFQLQGSGWYATDFRGGSGGGAPAAEPQDSSAVPATPTATSNASCAGCPAAAASSSTASSAT